MNGIEYDSVARCVLATIHGHTETLTVAEFEAFLESGCAAMDSRTTSHPHDFEVAVIHIRHARTADLAVA